MAARNCKRVGKCLDRVLRDFTDIDWDDSMYVTYNATKAKAWVHLRHESDRTLLVTQKSMNLGKLQTRRLHSGDT